MYCITYMTLIPFQPSCRFSVGRCVRLVGTFKPRLRPLKPYGELSTRLMISFANGSYFVESVSEISQARRRHCTENRTCMEAIPTRWQRRLLAVGVYEPLCGGFDDTLQKAEASCSSVPCKW